MNNPFTFFSENYGIIIATAIAIFGLLVFISVYNINLNTPTVNTKLSQVVTVETFEQNMNKDTNANANMCPNMDPNMDLDKYNYNGNKYSP